MTAIEWFTYLKEFGPVVVILGAIVVWLLKRLAVAETGKDKAYKYIQEDAHSTRKVLDGVGDILKKVLTDTALYAKQNKENVDGIASSINDIQHTLSMLLAKTVDNNREEIEDLIQRVKYFDQKSSERLWAVLDNSSEGWYEADHEGKCLRVNRVWCALTGIDSIACHGWGWLEGIHPDDVKNVKKEWIDSIQERRIFDLRYKTATGVNVHGRAYVLRDVNTVIGYIGVITKT